MLLHVAVQLRLSFEVAWAAGLVGMLLPRAAASGVTLALDASAAPPRFTGDKHRLAMVALNLLSNAIKFTPRGGRVQLALAAVSGGGTNAASVDGLGGLRLEVSDTGEGMSAEQVAALFAPFHQASASVARRHGGTGLGLYLSKLLVTAMGGTITVTLPGAPGGMAGCSPTATDNAANGPSSLMYHIAGAGRLATQDAAALSGAGGTPGTTHVTVEASGSVGGG